MVEEPSVLLSDALDGTSVPSPVRGWADVSETWSSGRRLSSLSGVWASRLIPKGKRFGPFAGEKKKRSQVTSNVYMWEVGRRGRHQLFKPLRARSWQLRRRASDQRFSRALTMMSAHVCPCGRCKSKPCLLVSPRFISQHEVGCVWTPQTP